MRPSYVAPVAQWIEHQTSNLGVAGSSPARGIFFVHQGTDTRRILGRVVKALDLSPNGR